MVRLAIMGISLTAAIGSLVYQAYFWLRTGEWQRHTAWTVLGWIDSATTEYWVARLRNATDWRGLATVVYWILDTNIAVLVLVAGVLIGWLVIAAAEKRDER